MAAQQEAGERPRASTLPARPNAKRGAKKWYYASSADTTSRVGPVTKAAIVELVHQGKLEPSVALAWRKGLDGWTTLDACAELRSALQRTSPTSQSLSEWPVASAESLNADRQKQQLAADLGLLKQQLVEIRLRRAALQWKLGQRLIVLPLRTN